MYSLTDSVDVERFRHKARQLIKKGADIELKEIRPVRTLRENRYVHALLGLLGGELGYSIEEIKVVAKRSCPFMRYEKDGIPFLKHTSMLDTKEMSDFIDWLRNWASIEHGIYLPTSEEYINNNIHIDKQICSRQSY